MKKRSLALDDVFAEHGAEPWPVTPRSRCFKGGGGGGTTTTQTVQDNSPWSAQQEPLKFGFEQARNVYDSSSPTYFQGNTVAGQNQTQQVAQGMTMNRALNGNPLNAASQGEAARTLNGDYLRAGNPNMTALTQAIDAQVRPTVDSRFSGSGRFGSAGHEGAYTSAMANAIAPQMFNSYEAERNRMGATAANAPAMAQADYFDAAQLGNVGLQQQQQSQADINAQIEKHNFEQNAQANKLADYMGLINGGFGGSNNMTQTQNTAGGKGGSAVGDVSSLAGAGANSAIAYKLLTAAPAACHPSFKENKEQAPPVLDKIRELDVEAWNYKPYMGLGEDRHIGPYADQFRELFGVGDGTTIHPVDMMGVLLLGIKELSAKIDRLEARNG